MRLLKGDPIPTVVVGDTIRVIDGGRPSMGYQGELVKVSEVENSGSLSSPNWWVGGRFTHPHRQALPWRWEERLYDDLLEEESDNGDYVSFWMENVEVVG